MDWWTSFSLQGTSLRLLSYKNLDINRMLLHSDILAPKEENCVGKHNFGRHMDQCAWEYRRI